MGYNSRQYHMKKLLSLSLVLFMGITCMQADAGHPSKLLHGKFQTAKNSYVKFASGNLNYSGTNKQFGLFSSQYEARGNWNESRWMRYVADVLADVYHTTFEQIDTVTTSNAKTLFGLK